MTKEGSAKIVNFITIGAGGLMLGRGCISHYSEYGLSYTLSIYIILIVKWMYATLDFYLFYDVAAVIQICALLARRQCRASDTQETVKALGLLVKDIQRPSTDLKFLFKSLLNWQTDDSNRQCSTKKSLTKPCQQNTLSRI